MLFYLAQMGMNGITLELPKNIVQKDYSPRLGQANVSGLT